MRTALILPIYNRPHYLRQCFDSLRLAEFPEETTIILINDASTDLEAIKLFDEFNIPGVEVLRFLNVTNKGIKANLLMGYDLAFNKLGCEVVMNLDSDAIVKIEFYEVTTFFVLEYNEHIVTGFNSTTKNADGDERHKIIGKSSESILLKYSVGGIHMAMKKIVYEKYLRPALLMENGNWDHNACINSNNGGTPIACITPSVVQHIGYSSSMNHNHQEVDYASDFKMLSLPNVTLFGADTSNYSGLMKACEVSTRDIEFGAVKMLTYPDVDFKNKEDYNYFMVKKLVDHIDTDFVINIQYDGYILNYKAWDDEWLKVDYVGARWNYHDGKAVGNGGFSLRSKKLLEVLAKDDYITEVYPEDHHICRTYRPYLEKKYGIKFATMEQADRFSIEAYGSSLLPMGNLYSGQFGFHGYNVDYTGADLCHIPKKIFVSPPVKVRPAFRGYSYGNRKL